MTASCRVTSCQRFGEGQQGQQGQAGTGSPHPLCCCCWPAASRNHHPNRYRSTSKVEGTVTGDKTAERKIPRQIGISEDGMSEADDPGLTAWYTILRMDRMCHCRDSMCLSDGMTEMYTACMAAAWLHVNNPTAPRSVHEVQAPKVQARQNDETGSIPKRSGTRQWIAGATRIHDMRKSKGRNDRGSWLGEPHCSAESSEGRE
ncbi:hypothetical protein An13g03070 [Aspergillus niger]|uniref:Uncharacterized protein n=2 Tax=Aspergillus niger TaxID=5061 RepID=A2R203_ASPNC|nr:hypothetical protein An13g03070 [Aspergillus niger]CAK41703.1 hypothetical protein An13g03070 [Aspergillus niger]